MMKYNPIQQYTILFQQYFISEAYVLQGKIYLTF
jgi:hypothetical protein